MARLPKPGLDNGTWGEILNDYLSVVHTPDGTLKTGLVNEANLSGSLQTKINNAAGDIADGSIAEAKLSTGVQTKLNAASAVTSVNGQTGAVNVTKTSIGLDNVNNTSDAAKPISTTAQAALDDKASLTHAHVVADVTDLQVALDDKADLAHAHIVADVTDLQAALDGKQPTGDYATTADLSGGLATKADTTHGHTASQIADSTAVGRSLVTAIDAAAARTAIGAGASDLVIGTTAGTAKAGDYLPTKGDVGLANVDNTSDAAKPISTAMQSALDLKSNASSLATVATSGSYTDLADQPTIPTVTDATAGVKGIVQLTGDLGGSAANPTVPGLAAKEPTIISGTTAQYYRGDKSWRTLDKAAVGLTNIDNTSDANKPISTATQAALSAKADATSVGAKILLIDNAAALPAGTPAGVIVVVKA